MTLQAPAQLFQTPGAIVDALGRVKAQMADLKVREDALKDQLKATGLTEVDGAVFRATITEVEAERVDTGRVRLLLADLVEAGTITRQKAKAMFATSAATTIRVVARRGV